MPKLKVVKAKQAKPKANETVKEVKIIEDKEHEALLLRRELLVNAYKEIKEGKERFVILNYSKLNSDLSNEKFFINLHKDLKTGLAKGKLFGLCKAQSIDLSTPH